jgi:hypothetical protein
MFHFDGDKYTTDATQTQVNVVFTGSWWDIHILLAVALYIPTFRKISQTLNKAFLYSN